MVSSCPTAPNRRIEPEVELINVAGANTLPAQSQREVRQAARKEDGQVRNRSQGEEEIGEVQALRNLAE